MAHSLSWTLTLVVMRVLLNVVHLHNALLSIVKHHLWLSVGAHHSDFRAAVNSWSLTSSACNCLCRLLIQKVLKIAHISCMWLLNLVGNWCLNIFLVSISCLWSISDVPLRFMRLHSLCRSHIATNSFSLLGKWGIHLVLGMKQIMDILCLLPFHCFGVVKLNLEVLGHLLSLLLSSQPLDGNRVLNIGVAFPTSCKSSWLCLVDPLGNWLVMNNFYLLSWCLVINLFSGCFSCTYTSPLMLLSHFGSWHSELPWLFKLHLSLEVLWNTLTDPIDNDFAGLMVAVVDPFSTVLHPVLEHVLKLVMNHTYLIVCDTESLSSHQTFDCLELIEKIDLTSWLSTNINSWSVLIENLGNKRIEIPLLKSHVHYSAKNFEQVLTKLFLYLVYRGKFDVEVAFFALDCLSN